MGERVPVNLSGRVEHHNGVCGDGGGNYSFVFLFLSNGLGLRRVCEPRPAGPPQHIRSEVCSPCVCPTPECIPSIFITGRALLGTGIPHTDCVLI